MALDKAKKAEIIGKFSSKETDTGSPAIQIALLTQRIEALTAHLQRNIKDHSSKLGMLKLVGQRRRLLRYLRQKDIHRYAAVIKELGLKDKA
ncbi:MAG: 30S ribosomal protein S15 [Helicobacteraceae bacterium]|jgi:small subunit ribosomal protein S15|nr:30S ribosomal protein S15 [Helicobacteraceae bacterium]